MRVLRDDVLNFVVVGNTRSGTSIVQSAISARDGVHCHANLFHDIESVRREEHEAYFGECPNPVRLPEWYVTGLTNPWQYIGDVVFKRPQRGEQAIGMRLLYPTVEKLELFSFFRDKHMEGDFCVIHVDRNPVSCFVSLKQAEKSGVWQLGLDDDQPRIPLSISIEADELVAFVRTHLSLRTKIRQSCPDALEITYTDLFVHTQPVMRKVWDFLELDDTIDAPAQPGCRRLRNNRMRDRISNFALLQKALPNDVRELMSFDDTY